MLIRLFSLVAALLVLTPGIRAGTLTLPRIFADHSVLQADLPAPIWGQASPGDSVTVEFGGQSKSATADGEGAWALRLDAMPPSAEPRVLTVRSKTGGERVLNDVLVGEVWLCAGQSNMFRPLGKIEAMARRFPGVTGAEEAINKPADPQMRLFCDDEHELWNAAGWQHATPTSRRPFSATAYFFGTALRAELKVPVGLIHVSRGGSAIQAWTPREAALRVPITKHYNAIQQANREAIAAFGKARLSGESKLPVLSPEVATSRSFGSFHLYDRLVEPLAPYAMRGITWYQGESNSAALDVAQNYDLMMQALISGWRDRWKQSRLPFYFVQLPCWDRGVNWPWTRQSQLNVSRTTEDVAMAVTVDFGDQTDLHPPEKQEVGNRLANLALTHTYDRARPSTGPLVSKIMARGNALHLSFDSGGSPLTVKGKTWNDIEIAGADGVFHPAAAVVTGKEATVTSKMVKSPVAVRYGWRPLFDATLFNANGLPASPFWYFAGPDGTIRPPARTVNSKE